MLKKFTISDWPNMKKDSRETLHRKLHKVAFPETYARTITPEQLALMIKAGKL